MWTYITTFLMACLPIVELKGAIPYGVANGLPLMTTFLIAYLGAALPVPFILLFLRPVMEWLKKSIGPFRKFAHWLEQRSNKKGGKIQKYEYPALFVFVAIPLPTTGVWTGALIATVLGLDFKKSLATILLGNLVAGAIMLAFSQFFFGTIL